VVGWSDPYDDGHRDYAVHFNSYGETMAVPEAFLESVGRVAGPGEIVSRRRARGKRTPIQHKPGD